MSPEGSGQTDSNFQQASEDNNDVLVDAGSKKTQQSKDPDLRPQCLAVRDNWGIISHLHLYLGPCHISSCADCIKQSPF